MMRAGSRSAVMPVWLAGLPADLIPREQALGHAGCRRRTGRVGRHQPAGVA
ncbi:hypothetical protein LMG29660_00215 [Burkholderia puraquae]|uniref:Uncharacterized protein n=1 Tax=Burkholderia puraquae TaxID=1904757 RepID=A0A6J5CZY7_9BURK|nr:hypothetical protein LMG29660_00215 [Burkholderia puraquae]